MKIIIYLFLALFLAQEVQSQDSYVPDGDKVSFVHGINSSGSSFDGLDNYLKGHFKYQSFKRDYPNGSASSPRLKDIAGNSRYRPIESGSYVVAHSQGGLLAREYARRGLPMEGLVMIGTPHKGTELAQLTASEAAGMFNRWTSSVFSPWHQMLNIFDIDPHLLTILERSYTNFGQEFNTIHWSFLDAVSYFYTSSHHRQLMDLREDSDYLDVLNVEPQFTFPGANKTWFLWATEDWNAPARLAQSYFWGGQAEDGWGAQAMDYWATTYFGLAGFAYENSEFFRRACYNGYYDACEKILPWHRIANSFSGGGYHLQRKIQEDWSRIALGESANFYTRQVPDDGIVPVSSQYPRFNGFRQNRHVEHTNHWEQRSTVSARLAIIYALEELELDPSTN